MMKVKAGVKLAGATPYLIFGLFIAHSVYMQNGLICRVTSIKDGDHSRTSLHYQGNAADLGTKHPEGTQYDDSVKMELQRDLENALGSEWDIVLEDDHIHIEWQPEVA